MPEASNVWGDVPDWGGGVGARRLVRAPGGSLGASLWELQPGASQFVYHFHHGTEELLVVLRGSPTVRMHDGDRGLAEGDVVPFPRGPEGGHQVRNDGDSPARVLIVSANGHQPQAASVVVGQGPARLDLTLVGSGGLTGVVRAAGNPLGGATVTLTDSRGEVTGAAITNPDGSYSFSGVGAGT